MEYYGIHNLRQKKKIPDERISPDIKSEQNSLNKKKIDVLYLSQC